jgi:hypothetical protein
MPLGPPLPAPGLEACGEDPTPHPAGGVDLPACRYDPASSAN